MSKLSTVKDRPGELHFWCPGCNMAHAVYTNKSKEPCWGFNNDMELPTFSPSIRVMYGNKKGKQICHSFIKHGKIQFLNDCTHSLKGKTVDLTDWDDV